MAATLDVWIFTMNRGMRNGSWSRYVFPWNCEYFAHLGSQLYIRHGDIISYVDESFVDDNGVNYDGTIWWPWLDFGRPGVNKSLTGFDIVGEGTVSIEIGYDQTNTGMFTTPYAIPADSYPGQMIAIPVQAPTLSVRLTYDGGQAWEWKSSDLHIEHMRTGS